MCYNFEFLKTGEFGGPKCRGSTAPIDGGIWVLRGLYGDNVGITEMCEVSQSIVGEEMLAKITRSFADVITLPTGYPKSL